jgi:hypothetical protein
MNIEGNVGCDASLLANAADLAYANARMQSQTAGSGGKSTVGAVPSALTAPSSVVLAAALVTMPGSIGDISFDWYFTDSAADALTVVVQIVQHATAIAGGAVSGGWRVENGGTPVSVTGDSPTTVLTLSKTVTTGALSEAFNARFIDLLPGTCGVQIVVSASHNLSAMVFNGVVAQA